jgi:CO/xanthine dehydrogenase Mo-binding subunit
VVRTTDGAVAAASVTAAGIVVHVQAGAALDEVTLRSYCIGAAHMAFGWVTSEGIAVDADGTVLDLTIRSLGVLKASDTPHIQIVVDPSGGEPVQVSDAVFAAVAAATWRHLGCPTDWPTGT